MATGPEHYAEAERILDHAEEHAERNSDGWYLAAVMAAQVHATLAVAAATVADRGIGPQDPSTGWRAFHADPRWQEVTG